MAIAGKMKIASIGTSLPFLPMDSWMFEWTFLREGFHVSLVFLQQYVLWRCKSKPSETLGTSTAKLKKGRSVKIMFLLIPELRISGELMILGWLELQQLSQPIILWALPPKQFMLQWMK